MLETKKERRTKPIKVVSDIMKSVLMLSLPLSKINKHLNKIKQNRSLTLHPPVLLRPEEGPKTKKIDSFSSICSKYFRPLSDLFLK